MYSKHAPKRRKGYVVAKRKRYHFCVYGGRMGETFASVIAATRGPHVALIMTEADLYTSTRRDRIDENETL